MRTHGLSLFLGSLFGIALLLATSSSVAHAQTTDVSEPGPVKAKAKGKLKRSQILQMLTDEIDTASLQKQPLKLGEFLKWLPGKVESQKGTPLPISVDVDVFKAENPDAPPIDEFQVKFPASPPQTTVYQALEVALSQVPTANANYLIRQGKLEITTDSKTDPHYLLSEKVFAVFKNTPFTDAVEELSDQTGIGFVIDPRIGGKANTPVSATFPNNTAYEVAIIILTDMVGAEAILLRDVVYITTPANAQKLRPLQQQLQLKEINKKFLKKIYGPVVPGLPGAAG